MTPIPVHPMSIGPTSFGTFQSQCSPYSLGCLVAYAKAHRAGELTEHFDFRPITPTFYLDALPRVDALAEPGIFLFSTYVWNREANLTVARQIKQRLPCALIIFGGPEIPRQRLALREFFRRHECIDMVVRGEGEEAFAEVLETIAKSRACMEALRSCDFSGVPGITLRTSDGMLETPDRERPKSIEHFPSPYLAGLFDHWIDGTGYMSIETNRGCPYGCTFCDWGAATLAKIRTMSLERVFQEIEYAGKHEISTLCICDANFGILKRDVEIATRLVDVRTRYGYPKVLPYSNTKVVRPELQQIIKMLREAGLNALGQISMQTTDPTVLEIIKRSNIKTSEYDKLVEFFRKENIPAYSDLMVGLPGQTLDSCKTDLQFMFDRKIHTKTYPTAMLPNAPMADPDYRKRYAIEVDDQGIVTSTFSFTEREYEQMLDFCFAYKLFATVGVGMLKYLLLFMQIERGVRAVDYVSAWLQSVGEDPERYPVSRRLWEEAVLQRPPRWRDTLLLTWGEEGGEVLFGNLDAVFTEAMEIYAARFGVDVRGSDVASILLAQKAVLPNRTAEREVQLEHDVPAYFGVVRSLVNIEPRPEPWKPLRDFGPGVLRLEEERSSLAYNDFASPHVKLEVRSNLFV